MSNDPASGESGPVRSGDQLRAQLRDRALALRDIVEILVDGPFSATSATLFKDLENGYTAVLELKEPVLKAADNETVRDLLSGFASSLDEKARTVAWLAEETESVLAAWQEAYQTTAETQPDQVRVDIDHSLAKLSETLDSVATAQSDEDEAKESLDRYEAAVRAKATPSRADRERLVTLSEKLSKSRQEVVDAMDDVLAVLMPRPREPLINLEQVKPVKPYARWLAGLAELFSIDREVYPVDPKSGYVRGLGLKGM